MKYTEYIVGFREIPDKITLCINISNCPCHCPGCHSKHLWNDIGKELTENAVDALIKQNSGINCIAFMGGDAEPGEVMKLVKYVKSNYKNIMTAWYSGFESPHNGICLEGLDYLKLGPYIEEYGSLDKKTTNQKLWTLKNGKLENDITNMFWL